MFSEAGVMIHSGFCASNEPKFELARYLGECRDNEENLRSMFSEILAGTAVKSSETGARCPVDVCFARTGVVTETVERKGIGTSATRAATIEKLVRMNEIEGMITELVRTYKIIEDAEVLMHPVLEEIGVCPCCV